MALQALVKLYVLVQLQIEQMQHLFVLLALNLYKSNYIIYVY
jgi:hypothetical protein